MTGVKLKHVDTILAALRALRCVDDINSQYSQVELIRERCGKIVTGELPGTPDDHDAREALCCQAATSIEASELEDQQRWVMAKATPYAIVCAVLAPLERRASREARARQGAIESRPHDPTPLARCWLDLSRQLFGGEEIVLVPVEIDDAIGAGGDLGEFSARALATWALERVGPAEGRPGVVAYRRKRRLRGPLAGAVAETLPEPGKEQAA